MLVEALGFFGKSCRRRGRNIYATVHLSLEPNPFLSRESQNLCASMADTDGASEPVFRTNKRRKVFRKRADSNPEDAGAGAGDAEDRLNSTEAGQPEENGESSLRFQRRVGVKKRGIGFASTGGRRAGPPEDNQETAVVPTALDATQEMQIERFVRPTGREMVTEDKHMYVGADLATRLVKQSTDSVGWHT